MEDTFDYKSWMEYDYNPFVIYGKSGELYFMNQSAELLLSYVPAKTFYDLALTYAPIDFGFKTTFVDLRYAPHLYSLPSVQRS